MKLLALLSAAMLAMLAASFWIFRSAPHVTPCEERVLAESVDRGNVATATRRNCDGSVSVHVGVRKAGTPIAAQGEVFAAAGDAPIRMTWDAGALVVESGSRRVLREETHWRDVPVRTRLIP